MGSWRPSDVCDTTDFSMIVGHVPLIQTRRRMNWWRYMLSHMKNSTWSWHHSSEMSHVTHSRWTSRTHSVLCSNYRDVIWCHVLMTWFDDDITVWKWAWLDSVMTSQLKHESCRTLRNANHMTMMPTTLKWCLSDTYGVATVSRIDKITGLFGRISSLA